jgi:hypothetical protein
MFRSIILPAVFTLAACSASQAQTGSCNMFMNFETSDEVRQWYAVNDGVMGGLSSGGPRFDDGIMIFEGVINTNGGGFSSLRSRVTGGSFADASGVKLRVKSDGRAYKLTLRTNVTWRGRRVSFQGPIPQTKPGEWGEVIVPFSSLGGTIFGRSVRGAKFDRAAVNELGIILADGQDGPFKLHVDWIQDCSA